MTNESDGLVVQIKASKIYLAISIGVYLLSLFSAWHYFYNIWLSLVPYLHGWLTSCQKTYYSRSLIQLPKLY